MNIQDFYSGHEFFAHTYLGAHLEGEGATFRTFAPAADGIVVLWWPLGDDGEPSCDEPRTVEMHRVEDGNFYEASIPGASEGDLYQFRIYHGGRYVDHADPYGYGTELRPGHRSVIRDLGGYQWGDTQWMGERTSRTNAPLNIYELHLGSWRKRGGAEEASDDPADWYSYEEIADPLVEYLATMGFDAVEFLPLAEHPLDASWGYQPTGFFSPTSRYGTARQLMGLVDRLHAAGIAAILDFVPVHFAVDSFGLANYDGTALYEYPNDAVGVSEWGSHNFMHSRGEVRSFLQSSANYWLGAYHFDGLRMDAISRIIYWQGDEARGVNGNAVDFLRVMNSGVHALDPGCMLIAEDSTNYDGVTRPVEQGGLGFDYKWDMGWMHDTLEFFQTGPEWRPQNYHKLSFSMMYYYNERYLLPLSHDEVVHGKATVAQKMWGDYGLKFPQARALYLYMAAHPGKKLNFMGSEVAQLREWDERRQQDWFLTTYPVHDAFRRYCRDLNALYLAHPALWEGDYDRDGFRWLQVDDPEHVVYAIERSTVGGADGEGGTEPERIAFVFNLSDQAHEGYELPVPDAASAEVLIDTAWDCYGGTIARGDERATLEDGTLTADLPPFCGMALLLSPEEG